MIPIETLLTFFAASALLGIAPGPDNIFVLTQSALHGRVAGIIVMLGLCTGLVVHSLAVAGGIAVIFQTSAVAFSALKYIGALYLLYLAWQAFHAPASTLAAVRNGEARPGKLYVRGILMNLTNPKVSLFFLAFLPQFADPLRGPVWVQLLLLGGLFILATLLVFGGIAILAGTVGEWLHRSPRAQLLMNRVAGTVFLGIAFMLAIAER